MEDRYVKFTILHTNDLHGDFLPHEENGHMVGGLSRLSGYVKKVREEEENVLYLNAGDMFNGSIIDSEYRGLATVMMLNCMTLDCATIGNHEVDYGVPHIVFVDRCTYFPVVNCNLYVPLMHKRLFDPFVVLEKGGIRILITGFLTQSALSQTKNDELISSLLEIDEPMDALSKYIRDEADPSKTLADMYIVLSHIGYEEDKKFAEELYEHGCSPHLIIGGHSHTLPEDVMIAGDSLVVQAGTGSGQIGRLDLVFDNESKRVTECRWQAVKINEETAPEDPIINKMLDYFVTETDKKYNCIISVLERELTHPDRFAETELGNFYCDLLKDATGADIVFLGSGSIRSDKLPQMVKRNDLLVNFPYTNELQTVSMKGSQIRTIWTDILGKVYRRENNPFLQVSRGFEAVYDKDRDALSVLRLNGEDIRDDALYRVCMQKYSIDNIAKYGLTIDELKDNGRISTVATSDRKVLEEELANGKAIKDDRVEGRLVIR